MRRSSHTIAVFAVIGLCVAMSGCARPPSEGGSSSSRAEKGRREAETLAVDTALAGAAAHAQAEPALVNARASRKPSGPRGKPRAGAPLVVRELAASGYFATEADAEEDVLTQASELIERKLAELDPPLLYKPTKPEVKEFLRKETRTVRPPDAEEKITLIQHGLPENLVKVEYDLEISSDQVRELRSSKRVADGMRIAVGLMAIALAAFLFLRADEWTKGYLTSWLALGAVTLAGATAAALVFI